MSKTRKVNDFRINGFEQIKAFYSWVFNNPDKVRPVHVSLYLFFINQANRNNWVEWFKCPYDLAMQGGCIGSKNTYYKILPELQQWGLIKYRPGVNQTRAPIISLIRLYKNDTSNNTTDVPLSEPLSEQLTEQLSGNKYKLLTNNLKLITSHLDEVVDFLNSKYKDANEEEVILSWRNSFEIYLDEMNSEYDKLINDHDFLEKQKRYHPNIDILLSLEKAKENFWGTEAGWNSKKKKKSKSINWKLTFTNAIELNKVWRKNEKTQTGYQRKSTIPDNANAKQGFIARVEQSEK